MSDTKLFCKKVQRIKHTEPGVSGLNYLYKNSFTVKNNQVLQVFVIHLNNIFINLNFSNLVLLIIKKS